MAEGFPGSELRDGDSLSPSAHRHHPLLLPCFRHGGTGYSAQWHYLLPCLSDSPAGCRLQHTASPESLEEVGYSDLKYESRPVWPGSASCLSIPQVQGIICDHGIPFIKMNIYVINSNSKYLDGTWITLKIQRNEMNDTHGNKATTASYTKSGKEGGEGAERPRTGDFVQCCPYLKCVDCLADPILRVPSAITPITSMCLNKILLKYEDICRQPTCPLSLLIFWSSALSVWLMVS